MLCLQWYWSKTPPACWTWQPPRCGIWWTLTTICPWYYCEAGEYLIILIILWFNTVRAATQLRYTDANNDDGREPNHGRQMHSLSQDLCRMSTMRGISPLPSRCYRRYKRYFYYYYWYQSTLIIILCCKLGIDIYLEVRGSWNLGRGIT